MVNTYEFVCLVDSYTSDSIKKHNVSLTNNYVDFLSIMMYMVYGYHLCKFYEPIAQLSFHAAKDRDFFKTIYIHDYEYPSNVDAIREDLYANFIAKSDEKLIAIRDINLDTIDYIYSIIDLYFKSNMDKMNDIFFRHYRSMCTMADHYTSILPNRVVPQTAIKKFFLANRCPLLTQKGILKKYINKNPTLIKREGIVC